MDYLINFITDPVFLILLSISLFYMFSISTFKHWKKLKIPFLEPVPYFGNFIKFTFSMETIKETLDRIYKAFPDQPLVGFYQVREPILMVRDPDIIEDITSKHFNNFVDHGLSKAFFNADKSLNPLQGHLFTLEGDRWKNFRQKLSPAFSANKIKHMTNQIEECLEEWMLLVEKLTNENDSTIDVREISAKLTTDIIGTCAFGLDCGTLRDPKSQFREMGRKAFLPNWKTYVRILANSINTKLLKIFHLTDIPSDVTNYFLTIVKEATNYRKNNKVTRPDFLQILLDLQNSTYDPNKPSGPDTFDDLDVAANAFIFIVGGFEPTSQALSFTMYELALHPQIQQKLQDEVDQVMRTFDGKLNTETIKQLEYMDMVISETLRKYPPGVALSRVCTQPYKITNTDITLAKGTMIFIPAYSIHHDEKYYPNPEEFIPERFSEENKNKIKNCIYMPFGNGPRNCIATSFAKMELKMALAKIISKYEFSPCKQTEIPVRFVKGGINLLPKGGIFLNVTKRN